MATLSITTRSVNVDGIILWHKIDGHIVQDYLHYRENPNYLQALYVMELLQKADEKNTFVQLANKQIIAP
jgi:hypothetical protein